MAFLNKISLDWPLTLTTQLSTSKLSDNPAIVPFLLIFQQFLNSLSSLKKEIFNLGSVNIKTTSQEMERNTKSVQQDTRGLCHVNKTILGIEIL